MTETFYEVLGASPDASTDEIREAYRERVKETHPDVSDAPDAHERFQRVQRAKDVLTDDAERARYDRLGHDRYVGDADPTGPAGNADDGASGDGAGTGTGDTTAGRSSTTAGPGDAAGGTSGSSDARTGRGTAGDDAGEGDAGSTARGAAGGVSDEDAASWAADGVGQRRRRRDGSGSAYATRTEYTHQSFDRLRVPLTPRTAITMVTTFVVYPVLVFAAVLPQFPLFVNAVLGFCTLFVVAYLVSMPEVAIVVFGAWSVLAPLVLVGASELSLFSLVGVIALVASWFPLGLALLTRMALRS